MKTLELLSEQIRKKSSNVNYSLEKSKLKAEFVTMCKKYLSSPKETLVFSFSTPRDLSTFLDIVDEDGHIIETVIVSGNSESEELTDSNKTDDLDTGNVDDSTSTPEETINSSNNTDGTSGTSGETQSDENNVAEDVSSDNTTGV